MVYDVIVEDILLIVWVVWCFFDFDVDLVEILQVFVVDFMLECFVVVDVGVCVLGVVDLFECVVCVFFGQQVIVKGVIMFIGCFVECYGIEVFCVGGWLMYVFLCVEIFCDVDLDGVGLFGVWV